MMHYRPVNRLNYMGSAMLRIIACVVVFPITMLTHAQEPEEAVPTQELPQIKGRKAWFLCTEIPENLRNPVSVLVHDKIHEVTLSIRNMSDPFPIDGDGSVKIVEKAANPAKPGTFIYNALSDSKVADEIENALIILVPAPQKDGQKLVFNSRVMDLSDFRGGDYLYLNLSPKTVGISLGDQRSVLKPGELKIQSNRDIKAATNEVLSFHYHTPEDDQWKLIVATTVVVQPTRREICIFHWNQKAGCIDYRGAVFPVEP